MLPDSRRKHALASSDPIACRGYGCGGGESNDDDGDDECDDDADVSVMLVVHDGCF